MIENQQPLRPGIWPIEHAADLGALEQDHAEQQAEQEYGQRYARYWGAVAHNELAFDITRLTTATWEKR